MGLPALQLVLCLSSSQPGVTLLIGDIWQSPGTLLVVVTQEGSATDYKRVETRDAVDPPPMRRTASLNALAPNDLSAEAERSWSNPFEPKS